MAAKRRSKARPVEQESELTLEPIEPKEPETTSLAVRMGRPPSFEKPSEFTVEAEGYFEYCSVSKMFPTKSGLALWCGIAKSTLQEYEKKEDFSAAIKKSYSLIEEAWVQRLTKAQATGAIFYLKNAFNADYKDEWNMEGGGNRTVVFVLPKEIAERHGVVAEVATVEAKPVVVEKESETI